MNDRIDIQTCLDQHVAIRYLLEELAECPRDERKLLSTLGRLKTVLTAHLRLEDDWLYPKLCASNNLAVAKKARQYSREMGNIKQQFLELYSKWSVPGAIEGDHDAFCQEIQEFSGRLETRMHREDTDLYVEASRDALEAS